MITIRYFMILVLLIAFVASFLAISLKTRSGASLMTLLSCLFLAALLKEAWREYHLLQTGEIPAVITPARQQQLELLTGLFAAWLTGLGMYVESAFKAFIQRRCEQIRRLMR